MSSRPEVEKMLTECTNNERHEELGSVVDGLDQMNGSTETEHSRGCDSQWYDRLVAPDVLNHDSDGRQKNETQNVRPA